MSYFGKKVVQDYLSTDRLRREGLRSDGYDEPTYLGFKIHFETNDLGFEWSNNSMPHGLLLNSKYLGNSEEYLHSINQGVRAQMLSEFKSLLNTIQTKYQWVFTEVAGLADIYKINPADGYRGRDKVITIKFNESLDNKMSYLLDLYRKLSFDVENMKWMLPDIMRFFKMTIYVSEIRSFHQPKKKGRSSAGEDSLMNNGLPGKFGSQFQAYGTQTVDKWDTQKEKLNNLNILSSEDLTKTGHFLKYLDANISVMAFELEQCEFDISSFNISSLENLTTIPDASATGTFSIKVGKIRERNIWSLWDVILTDANINKNEATIPNLDPGTKSDILKTVGGDSDNADNVYDSLPYVNNGDRHLGEDGGYQRSITDNLLSDLEEIAVSRVGDFVEEKINKQLLGNVYGLSLTETVGLLQGGLSGAITAVNNLLNNRPDDDTSNVILGNMYDSFNDEEPAPTLLGDRSVSLESQGLPLGSVVDTDFDETATDIRNNGDLGNIGYSGSPSSINEKG